jgi:7,8-dihydropterin-6-yl-methyl-4-(beta-D-ribofuranosyl)aminobenzene 5'-phosphate synthase
MQTIDLSYVDRAEVTILVDNYTDLLLSDTDTVKRLRIPPPAAPMAEHGLSYLVSVYAGGRKHTILMDAGISGSCLNHNAALLANSLGVKFGVVRHSVEDVQCIILSHGHFDHFGGLEHFLRQAGRKIPLIVHSRAFAERRIKLGPDFHMEMPTLSEAPLASGGAVWDKRDTASTLADDLILLTGSVPRITDFETGAPSLEAKQDGQWRQDGFEDDQALAFRLKDRGLVILGGCSHAGIINTVEHIRNVSGEQKVHAVIGGFHLSGAGEALIEPTIEAMRGINPHLLVPTHCTGWKAINAFAAAMPESFVLNSVGTTYLFGGEF